MAYQRKQCLVLDSSCSTLSSGELLGERGAAEIKIFIPEEHMTEVLSHEVVQVIGMGGDEEDLVGRITRKGSDYIILGELRGLGENVRQNLRVPIQVDTFIYPLSGVWSGRRPAQCCDLSCGGVAFYCDEELRRGERVEIVVPSISDLLILQCEILRRRPDSLERPLYAAKFVDLCHDEECRIREQVFQTQLEQMAEA